MADDVIDLTGDSDGDSAPLYAPRHRGGFLVEDAGVIDLTRSDSDVEAADDVAAGEPLLSVAEVLRRVAERSRAAAASGRKRSRSPAPADASEPAVPFNWPRFVPPSRFAGTRPRSPAPAPPPAPPRVALPPPPPPPRNRARVDDDATFDFEAEVTGLQLWRPIPAPHAMNTLTHTFENAATYMVAFSVPLLEEARESIRHAWASECANAAAGRSARGVLEVRLVSVQPPPRGATHGWYSCVAEAAGGGPLPRLLDNSVAILSAAAPGAAPLDALRQAERGPRHTAPEPPPLLHFAAFLQCEHDSGTGGGYRPPPRLRFFVGKDEDDDAVWPLFRGSDVVERLKASQAAAPAAALTWHLAVVGRLASSSAECRALRAVGALPPPVLAALLRPMPPGQAPPGNAVSSPPDYAALPPPPLPPALSDAFAAHLARGFNGEQRAAIHWVAVAGNDAMFAGRNGSAGFYAQLRGDDPPPPPRWPFTLVQGPPGTGKSHTLWGMLNALHVLGTRHEAQQLAAMLSRREDSGAAAALYDFGGDDDYDEYDEFDGYDPDDAYFAQHSRRRQGSARRPPPEDLVAIITHCKPHILVCAPSNAAVDVLVARVLQKPFAAGDEGGESYTPRVARLASEGTDTHAGIAAADCGKRIDALMAQTAAARGARAEELSSKVRSLTEEVQGLRAATLSPTSEPVRCAALAAACVRLRRCTSELRRLQLLHSRQGRSARELLELSFLDDADIVFTTLGSAGRSVFRRCVPPFDIVLIDEAAQATETAALLALQRLQSSSAATVLVGDPAQLPATVLSSAARGAAYERSLFERLASCDVPSMLLTRQYRMHAEIAAFPSAYFYGSRLLTDASVLSRPAVPYDAAEPLAPFVFFDAHQGSEQRAPGSSSTHNSAEAKLAAQLYRRLAALSSSTLVSLAPRVGIVTPYKGQCEKLKRVFLQRFGQGVLDALVAAKSINTVDGFQGAEREVIIFTLVRTRVRSGGGGGSTRAQLGHVDDVRRMNVGLTRAQRALWVVGHEQALKASPHWDRLLQHAHACRRVIRHPSKQTSLLDDGRA